MSKESKKVNLFFKEALRCDVENLKEKIFLSERQKEIFEMFYIKKMDISFIESNLYICRSVVNAELKTIRHKILKVI